MKIALLGPASSGKTVYFTALYHRFRNEVGAPTISSAQMKLCKRSGVSKKVGFRMRVDDPDLEAELSANARILMQRPIQKWPEPTDRLNESRIGVRFDFLPFRKGEDLRSYDREILLFDPTGEAMTGEHAESSSIINALTTCDIGIIFLPADVVLDALDDTGDLDEDRLAEITAGFALGKTTEILKEMNRIILGDDIFPVCFVISKSDLVPKDKVELINKIIYDKIIASFSKDNKSFMVCVCPTAVVDPVTGNFKAANLEWPFLFAAGGTIFRNSRELMKEGQEIQSIARRYETEADDLERLYESSPLKYFWNWCKSWGEDTFNSKRQTARSYYNSAGRQIEAAEDDAHLARDIWTSIDAESQKRGLRVFMAGKRVKIGKVL